MTSPVALGLVSRELRSSSVGTAIIGLLGALVGGSLVLIGDVIARRSERHTARLERLRVAAAEVIASYLHLIEAQSNEAVEAVYAKQLDAVRSLEGTVHDMVAAD